MSWKKIALFVCLLLVLAGCSAGSKAPPPQSPRDATATADSSARFAAEESTSSFGGQPAPQGTAQPGFNSASPAPPPPAPQSDARPASKAPSGGSAGSASRAEPKADSAQRAPAPEQRPGLGTEWGETRVSKVHDVTFVRDSNRPFALAMMNYNDRKGVDALVAAQGRRDSFRSIPTTGGAVNIAIKDANGEALEAVKIGDRTFVIGQAGQRYTIVLTNKTSHRFEAVTTVDGLDVVNGKDGSFDNRGYVLMPFATLEIEGFRQSSNAVAAFRFASVAESYATAMGKARNIGVIGVALFSERGDTFVPEGETRMRDTASPFPADPRFAPPPPNR